MYNNNSLRYRLPFAALAETLRDGYGWNKFRHDLLAGLTVGVVAIPLAMALAIAIGVPPQHGLYTSIFAGFLISLTGGSRFNISGPTAAFVVILMPIVAQYGLGGLLLATMMSGALMVVMGLTGLGGLVRFVPYPVVVGFTAGIAVVIAGLQLGDLLGLIAAQDGAHFLTQLNEILHRLPEASLQDLGIGLATLAMLIAWPRLKTAIPAPLIAMFVAGMGAWLLARWIPGFEVATVASRFTYEIGGVSGQGIPPMLPELTWPWLLPGADGQPLKINFELWRALLGPAMAITMLGAIESLLCAVIADGLTDTRHHPNAELVGQGLGNLFAPLFGGITATAALARTAASIRFGAVSPVAGMIHALLVLAAMVLFAGALSQLPMAALAALLLTVAWSMSQAGHFMKLVRTAPRSDVIVLLTCFVLTVVFDMVVAVAVGVGLAGMLFIQRMADVTDTRRLSGPAAGLPEKLPANVAFFRLRGPMFFGAAERALSTLHQIEPEVCFIILDMRDVTAMDVSAILVFKSMLEQLNKSGLGLVITHAPPRIIVKLMRSGLRRRSGQLTFVRNIGQALSRIEHWEQQARIAEAEEMLAQSDKA